MHCSLPQSVYCTWYLFLTTFNNETMPKQEHHLTYADVHRHVKDAKSQLGHMFGPNTRPDVLLAISGGGLIPARIVRTVLGSPSVPILSVGVHTYNDDTKAKFSQTHFIYQWLEEQTLKECALSNKNILICDDVDDSGATLHCIVKRLQEDLRRYGADEGNVSVFVLHQKQRSTELSEKESNKVDLGSGVYHACISNFPRDTWIIYPWEN